MLTAYQFWELANDALRIRIALRSGEWTAEQIFVSFPLLPNEIKIAVYESDEFLNQ